MAERPHRLKELHEELRSIYAERDGELPDLSTLEAAPKNTFGRFITRLSALLVILALAAWGGFALWARGVFTEARPLEVVLEGPETLLAGEAGTFTLRYKNTGNAAIDPMDLTINAPFGFELLSSNPPADHALTWKLPSLSPGSDATLVLQGWYRAPTDSTQTMQAFLTYRPTNIASDFQELATRDTRLTGSILRTEMTGPTEALAGDDVAYTINVQNTGSASREAIQVQAILPEGFSLTSANPPSEKEGEGIWSISSLAPQELRAISLTGRFSATASGPRTLTANTSFIDEGTALTQSEGRVETAVTGSNLDFRLVANGSTKQAFVDPGTVLRLSLPYKNSGAEELGDVVFSLEIDTEKQTPIDWARASLGSATRSGTTITWKPVTIAPNTESVFDLSLPLIEAPLATQADLIRFQAHVEIGRIGNQANTRALETDPIEVQINSRLAGSIEARYFSEEGEPYGTGPLPPKVGQTTTYRLFWSIANGIHPLKDTSLSTTLPPDVTWSGKTEADSGTLSYDATTRTVTWSLATTEAQSGLTAWFDVAITPKTEQVGSFMKLLNAASLRGTDTVTSDTVEKAFDLTTTELATDEEAAGKGVVVK